MEFCAVAIEFYNPLIIIYILSNKQHSSSKVQDKDDEHL